MAFTLVDLSGGVGAGGGEVIINLQLQEKTVDSSINTQHVKPTDGYIGIKEVTVNPYTLQEKTVDSSTVSQEIVADASVDGLSKVTVNPYELDEKTVDSSTVAQEVTSDVDGLSKVTINPLVLSPLELDSSTVVQESEGLYNSVRVNPYVLDSKTVDSSTVSQTVVSDVDGLSQVIVNPYVLDNLTLDSSTNSQSVEGQYGNVTVNPYVLDSKTVDSSTVSQTVVSDEDGLSSVTINPYVLDEKTVNSSTNEQEITSDADGLSKVTINPYVLDSKTVDSSTSAQTVVSDKDGLSSVTVNPYTLDSKTVDPSTNSQTITSDADGLSSVTVNPYVLDSKTVDSSTVAQVVTSDEDGLSQVTINPYVLGSLAVNSSTAVQEFTGQYGTVTVNPYVLDSSTVDSSTNSQTLIGQFGEVTINPYVLDSSTLVTTQNGEFVITSSADGLSRVDVSVNIDTQAYYDQGYGVGYYDGEADGIAEQKAKLDSSTLTINGTYTREDGWNEITVDVDTVNNQNKTVDSSTNSQTLSPDQGYTGLGQVVVNPYTLDSSTLEITTNGQYAVTSTADGLSRVDVSVGIDTQSYYDAGYSAGETAGIAEQKAKLDSSTFTENGTYTREDGWNEITVDIDTVNNQNKTVDSSTNAQSVTYDSGYTGLGTVTINPYTLENRSGGAVVYEYVNSDVNPGNIVITPTSGYNGLSQVTLGKAGILSTKTFTPTTSQQTWDAYNDTDELVGLRTVVVNAVTSSIDANITAGNIKNGVTILGVQGNYSGTTINNQNKSIDSSTNAQSVTYDSGYTGLETVTVNPYTLTTGSIDSSTAAQTVNVPAGYNGLSSVTISGLNLDNIYNTLAAY